MSSPCYKNQLTKLINYLTSKRNRMGYWEGKLSSSALSTAVAIVALKESGSHHEKIKAGLPWLLNNINNDGGFGDTPESISNISTSLLCYGAIYYCSSKSEEKNDVLNKIARYLKTQQIELSPDSITGSILRFYGKDFTFSIPILTFLAMCGVLNKNDYNKIPQLPFEFAVLPTKFYKFFNLQVVSYAIPALIAVGIAVFKKRTKTNPLMKVIRNKTIKPALKKLDQILPESGGFLEAIPLTGFVLICLHNSGFSHTKTAIKGQQFLVNQQRPDGSWPIDSDLATWVTTLSIKAIGTDVHTILPESEINTLRNYLLDNQTSNIHLFNNARPGGWGWSNLSGAMPDADDTSGAILALIKLYSGTRREIESLTNGVNWLLSLQNRDGGIPTFSKGWGKLVFDASCADITGHALLAVVQTLELIKSHVNKGVRKKWEKAITKMLKFLVKNQHNSGSWIPLWFGNQQTKLKDNKVYGTAKVLVYLSDAFNTGTNITSKSNLEFALEKAQEFLRNNQNEDGSWGGGKGIPGTIEETSLAVAALANSKHQKACVEGLKWLEHKTNAEGFPSAPIGLYFALLWYDEELYPYIFYTEALNRFKKHTG